MGIFFKNKNIKSSEAENDNSILNKIEMYYINVGFSKKDARTNALGTLDKCKRECAEEQTANLSRLGEGVFEYSKSDQYLAKHIEIAQADGATQREIIEWWSSTDVERKVAIHLDELQRLAAFIQYIKDGLTNDEAANKVKKHFPIFGYSEDYEDKSRPICPERMASCRNFIRTMSSSELMVEYMAGLIKKYHSFNELYRDKGFPA